MVKPNKLNKGDLVAIVSLSSGILGEDSASHQYELGIRRLKELGLDVVFMPNSLKGIDYIKNNPDKRAEDLINAFKDPKIKGIICAIGGDDTYKIAPYLFKDNYFTNLVKDNPKVFIGFSDSTNNHFMLNKIGLVTYYGLNFLSDICELSSHMLPYTKESYLRFFRNDSTYSIKPSNTWYKGRTDYSKDSLNTSLESFIDNKGYEVINGTSKVEGILFGGCLDSIYDMYTSNRYSDQRSIYDKYELLPNSSFYEDKIVFLETSEELMSPDDYKKAFDYFSSNNIIVNAKALIIGKPANEVYYNEYKEILSKLNIPIIYNVNFGHALPRAMIPYGVKAEINFNNKELNILEKLFKD